MQTKTVFDVYSEFLAASAQVNKSTLRSVIHRFLAEPWGGEAPKGVKATNEEVFALIELLKSKPASFLLSSMEVLEQEFEKKNIARENSKSYKSAYKAFLNWAESIGYCSQFEKEEVKPPARESLFTRQPRGAGRKQKGSYHNITYKKPYALMAKYSGNGKQSGQLVYETDYINNSLSNELKLFKEFRSESHNCSKGTLEKEMTVIYQILGWLHRYKNAPLDSLSLTSIISFINLNPSCNSFKDEKGKVNYQDYVSAKAMARQEAIDSANENKRLIEEYINFLGGQPATKKVAVSACIAVGKFIFKNEVGTDEYENDSDLPIVKRLTSLSSNFYKKSKSSLPTIAHSEKSIPWNEAGKILELLRQRIHCLEHEITRIESTKAGNKEYIFKIPRKESTLFKNLQRFLSLAFMLLIPTDRARTYYELEIGRTFVCGLYNEGRFTPIEKLQDKKQALWYIHLMPNDYKTGKTYKEYWGIMPNQDFGDGNNLYGYINNWIDEGRECEQKCNHNYFFRKVNTYKPLDSRTWGSRIRAIFVQETGIPVTPKELRKMYVTHLNNIKASDAERRAARHAMHQSQKMQDGVYNCQNSLDKAAPIMDLNERMWKEAFQPLSK